jgi:uncharacterized protein CbrC (UPF0167 family)
MQKEMWLVCVQCGYSKKVFSEQEVYDNQDCPLCQGLLSLDMRAGKVENEYGDNFPVIHKDLIEEHIREGVKIMGVYSTWETIEVISDVKMRIKYRNVFLKLGYKIPEKKLLIEKEEKLFVDENQT